MPSEAAVQLKNINPLGAVDLPLIGRNLEAGEVFDVPDKVGKALLDQAGNYEAVKAENAGKS